MDVLIVGAGPVGYMAAMILTPYNINFCINKRALPVQMDHASGLHLRTQEIFHTIGIFNKLTAQAGQMRETAFWALTQTEGGMSGVVSMELPSQRLRERAWELRLRMRRRIRVHVSITREIPRPHLTRS
jgi:2-polyprenyl-6-methoxyphenol hydroxylase-like FAD-dependent oxidoreductase